MPEFDKSLNVSCFHAYYKDDKSGQYKPLSLSPAVLSFDLAPPDDQDDADYERVYQNFRDMMEYSFVLSKRQISRTAKFMKKAANQAKRRRRSYKRVNEKMRRLALKGENDKWLYLILSDGRLSLHQKKNFRI